MSYTALSVLSNETTLAKYLREIQKFAFLTEEEEYVLAKRWKEQADIKAAHILVTSHLKLVAKIAMKFRRYGLPMLDLIAEGNIGLMKAVKKFEPDMGFRLSTYAMWWIKASIQDYILKSWSIVKIGTSAAQKKIFFNLQKIKNKLLHLQNDDNSSHMDELVAKEIGLSEAQLEHMEDNISNVAISLSSNVYDDNDDVQLLDTIQEPSDNQEIVLQDRQDKEYKQELLKNAISKLNERERHILYERRLKEKPATLEELSQHFKVSRERIRQIEDKIITKLQGLMVTV